MAISVWFYAEVNSTKGGKIVLVQIKAIHAKQMNLQP